MQREAFVDYLLGSYGGKRAGGISANSAKSYCAFVAALEAQLGQNLDDYASRPVELQRLADELRSSAARSEISPGALNNRLSGLKAYGRFLASHGRLVGGPPRDAAADIL